MSIVLDGMTQEADEVDPIIERCAGLTDRTLATALERLAVERRANSADFVAHLSEMDRRLLYAELGYSSLFLYCTRHLGLAEVDAYRKTVVAGLCKSFPSILPMIRSGRLHLSGLVLLAPHLTSENHRSLLRKACGSGRLELQRLLAGLAPRPEPRDCVRILSTGAAPGVSAAPVLPQEARSSMSDGLFQGMATGPSQPAAIPPTRGVGMDATEPGRSGGDAQGRVRFAFTGGESLLAKIERARELLRHKFPKGRLEDILDDALEALLDRKDPWRKLERRQRRSEALQARRRARSPG